MSQELGPVSYSDSSSGTSSSGRDLVSRKDYSEQKAREIDEEDQRDSGQEIRRGSPAPGRSIGTSSTLIAGALLERETLEGPHARESLLRGRARSARVWALMGASDAREGASPAARIARRSRVRSDSEDRDVSGNKAGRSDWQSAGEQDSRSGAHAELIDLAWEAPQGGVRDRGVVEFRIGPGGVLQLPVRSLSRHDRHPAGHGLESIGCCS